MSDLRLHVLGASAQLLKGACCEWTLVWARVEHFCYKLDHIKAFLHCVTFCNRRSAALSLANTVALIIGIFVLSILNHYCFNIYKDKDAKVSFKNWC